MQQLWERSENMWEKQLCRHQCRWRSKGRRCSRYRNRNSPTACGEDHGEAGCSSWEDVHPAACGGFYAGAGGHALKEAAACGVLTSWKGPMLEQLMKDCLLLRGSTLVRGRVWRGKNSRDDTLWPDCNLPFPSTCAAHREEVEELWVQLSLGRKKGGGKVFLVLFLLLTLLLCF